MSFPVVLLYFGLGLKVRNRRMSQKNGSNPSMRSMTSDIGWISARFHGVFKKESSRSASGFLR
jgi:hypothetical protein